MLSEIAFGSYLAYCPRGDTDAHRQSQRVIRFLKNDTVVGVDPKPITRLVAETLARDIHGSPLDGWFGPDVVLVPAPKSARLVTGGLWVPERLAKALVAVGLGREVVTCLERTTAVPKATFASAQDRPKAQQHYETMAVHRVLPEIRDVIIVDDVVTRGATLLGAASRLAEALPGVRVRGFAAIRTIQQPGRVLHDQRAGDRPDRVPRGRDISPAVNDGFSTDRRQRAR